MYRHVLLKTIQLDSAITYTAMLTDINLVLVDVVKVVPEASQFFSLLERLYVFFSGSYIRSSTMD